MPVLLLAAGFVLGCSPPPESAPPPAAAPPQAPVEVTRDGGTLTFTLTGPEVLSESGDPNPFTDYRLTASFSAGRPGRSSIYEGKVDWWSTGATGYFAADGDAANTGATEGNKWRVHLRPAYYDWPLRYSLTLWRRDEAVARGEGVTRVHGGRSVETAEDLRPRGLLSVQNGQLAFQRWDQRLAVEQEAVQDIDFQPIDYFYKIGANSPENLLAYADFDGTHPLPRREGLPAGELHRYAPHVADWSDGDPTWGHGETAGRGKGLIGALNYLAGAGVNAVYFLTYNVAGDGRDVWPYAAAEGPAAEDAAPDDRTRFDCSKLDQWAVVFDHAQRRGIVLHVVLTETENESLFEARDGGGDGPVPFADTRKLYYRELVARFAHHPGVVWNLGEEQGGGPEDGDGAPVSAEQLLAFGEFIKEQDPYDHPVVVHTHPPDQNAVYTPLLGSPQIDGVSLQLDPMERVWAETLLWRDRSAAAGRPWFVCLDEVGDWRNGVLPDDDPDADANRRRVIRTLWANLLAGGSGMEFYFGYRHRHNDLAAEDFRSRAAVWAAARVAREVAENELGIPGWTFGPTGHVIADPGPVGGRVKVAVCEWNGNVLAFVPAGRSVKAVLRPGARRWAWWLDPHAGGAWQAGSAGLLSAPSEAGAVVDVGPPPDDDRDRDWVLRLAESPDAPAPVFAVPNSTADDSTADDDPAEEGTASRNAPPPPG